MTEPKNDAATSYPAPGGPVEVLAHRGFSGVAPENTLSAFRRAIEAGADRLELDVQMASDGVPVVFHDDDLDRTSDGSGPLWGRSAEELQRLDAGGWFAPSFRGERIPTLGQTLELCRRAIPLNIELKVPSSLPDLAGWTSRLARVVARELSLAGLAAETIVSSFEAGALAAFARESPRTPRETLYLEGGEEGRTRGRSCLERALEEAFRAGSRGLSVSHEELVSRPGLPAEAHRRGLLLKVYTIDDPGRMLEAIRLGVDGIFTNHPDRLLSLLGRRPRASRP